jgi:hypothetical protein
VNIQMKINQNPKLLISSTQHHKHGAIQHTESSSLLALQQHHQRLERLLHLEEVGMIQQIHQQ